MSPEDQSAKPSPSCPSCGNRLRVRPDQVGEQLSCPKCKATFIFGQPARPPGKPRPTRKDAAAATTTGSEAENESATAPAADDDDAYEPEVPLTNFSIVPVEEMSDLSPLGAGESKYDVDWSVSDDLEREPLHARLTSAEPDYLSVADARGLVRHEVAPDPPKWTFFSGVFTFPWRGANIVRWAAMSVGMSMTFVLAWQTAKMLGLFGGLSPDAVMGIPLSMVTIALALATFALSAVCLIAAIQDTADGHHDPQEGSMPDLNQWLFTFISVATLFALAAALGTPFSFIPEVGPAACLVSGMLVFPILLLSAMEADSFFVPYSPVILATLRYYWHGWLAFYLIVGAMLGLWIFGFDALVSEAPFAVLVLSGPVLAAMLLVYGRLLGRLAWRASGASIATNQSRAAFAGRRTTGTSKRKKKKRRRMRFEFPDELSLPVDGIPEPPPIVNPRRRP
jgi:predicted RNA-binding Zn-ribbon protein involved in translation (DUF1610 family)